MWRRSHYKLFFCASQAFIAVAACSASAQIVILSSDVPTLAVNSVRHAGQRLKVPSGSQVLILLPSTKTITIPGPSDTSVENIIAGQVRDQKLWGYVKKWLDDTLSPEDSRKVAATKGSVVETREGHYREALLSWKTIPVPVSNDSTICVLRDAGLRFARLGAEPPSGSLQRGPTLRLSSRDQRISRPIDIKWHSLEEEASLPADAQVLAELRYDAHPNFALPFSLNIKFITTDEADSNEMLFRNKCYEQIKARIMTDIFNFRSDIQLKPAEK